MALQSLPHTFRGLNNVFILKLGDFYPKSVDFFNQTRVVTGHTDLDFMRQISKTLISVARVVNLAVLASIVNLTE